MAEYVENKSAEARVYPALKATAHRAPKKTHAPIDVSIDERNCATIELAEFIGEVYDGRMYVLCKLSEDRTEFMGKVVVELNIEEASRTLDEWNRLAYDFGSVHGKKVGNTWIIYNEIESKMVFENKVDIVYKYKNVEMKEYTKLEEYEESEIDDEECYESEFEEDSEESEECPESEPEQDSEEPVKPEECPKSSEYIDPATYEESFEFESESEESGVYTGPEDEKPVELEECLEFEERVEHEENHESTVAEPKTEFEENIITIDMMVGRTFGSKNFNPLGLQGEEIADYLKKNKAFLRKHPIYRNHLKTVLSESRKEVRKALNKQKAKERYAARKAAKEGRLPA